MTLLGRLVEWLFRREVIARARANPRDSASEPRRRLAEQTLDSARALLFRDLRSASILLREALRLALLLHFPETHALGVEASFRTHREFLESIDSKRLVEASARVIESSTSRDLDEANRPDVTLTFKLVEELIALSYRSSPSLGAELIKRRCRVSSVLAIMFACAGLAAYAHSTKRNIAFGRAWVASSAYPGYVERGTVPSFSLGAFFHTKHEQSAWLVIDLGNETYSRIEVTNRCDGYHERAVPLVIEESDDSTHWREIARRNDTFDEWSVTVPTSSARYLRLRPLRETYFHLCGVRVE